MGITASIPNEYAQLEFKHSWSVENATLKCEKLGINYDISTSIKLGKFVITFKRNNRTVAVWNRKIGRDEIEFYPNSSKSTGPMKVRRFMKRCGFLWGHRKFRASDGKEYYWSTYKTFKLYRADDDSVPIASFASRRYILRKRKQHIKIARECEDIVDYVLVTCVILEQKRREKRRQAQADNSGS
ncbi:uncharacterized protein FOMMEDRAFT_157834 [Fomitiporia mediterranea MF3/22]|uniref:uncharacterized protein n=1 Tax=Fomitiporia mediterranea (strain MF3/22) TaxID=694068 RepID=UPI0004407C50|nr:uncharacterized protein FOMMEDRAFT_157834 [Fomitiporia mediterranea MF3/22]EJD00734.1 hypothetical protein FOMMEDRAFT_157834 [Fomitiporia mediterranea MF3/22]